MEQSARQERFVALLDQHRKILFKVARAYCRDAAERPDLIQEITAQLWRSFASYDGRRRFSTWMYRVSLNVAISHARGASVRARHHAPADESILAVVDPGAPEESEVPLRQLHAMIDRLPLLERALVLLYLDGNSHDTIAEVMGISQSNVGTKIGRIKERLRREMSRAD